MKKLLLIAYFYPPLGGPGVQRPVKLVKYLKKFGWQTDVITVKDIVFHSYDKELAKEDIANSVIRAASLDPMSILKKFTKNKASHRDDIYFGTPEKIKNFIRNLFPIDDKIGWLPAVYKAGKKLLETQEYDAVMATIGPYTSALAAYKLSKKFNIPLIIDYRDHWTLNDYINYSTKFHRKHAERWETRILDEAKVVSVIGNVMKDELLAKFGSYLNSRMMVMYNGWDETDFSNDFMEKNQKLTLRYIGNFYGHRNPAFFIRALEKLDAELIGKIRVEFVGNYFKDTKSLFENSSVASMFKFIPQTDHVEAVKLMKTSDILLLFIAAENGDGVVTGKIFEYLRCQKPILAMIPESGEAAELLKANGHFNLCYMEDVDAIADHLKEMIKKIQMKQFPQFSFDPDLDREHQTKKFAAFLEQRL